MTKKLCVYRPRVKSQALQVMGGRMAAYAGVYPFTEEQAAKASKLIEGQGKAPSVLPVEAAVKARVADLAASQADKLAKAIDPTAKLEADGAAGKVIAAAIKTEEGQIEVYALICDLIEGIGPPVIVRG